MSWKPLTPEDKKRDVIGILVIVAIVGWLIHGEMNAAPTGYVGRDGNNDVYCGYKPDGVGSGNYTCEGSPAQYAPRGPRP